MSETRGPQLTDIERGLIAGLLIGEGHFGGDGRYPHITLRMHVRHESLFNWLAGRFPRTRLYGPYNHDGRRYYQWMARGPALAEDVLPSACSFAPEARAMRRSPSRYRRQPSKPGLPSANPSARHNAASFSSSGAQPPRTNAGKSTHHKRIAPLPRLSVTPHSMPIAETAEAKVRAR